MPHFASIFTFPSTGLSYFLPPIAAPQKHVTFPSAIGLPHYKHKRISKMLIILC